MMYITIISYSIIFKSFCIHDFIVYVFIDFEAYLLDYKPRCLVDDDVRRFGSHFSLLLTRQLFSWYLSGLIKVSFIKEIKL